MRRLFFPIILLLFLIIIPVLTALWLVGGEAKLSFKKIDFSNLEGWQDDGQRQAFEAFLKSCQSLSGNTSRPVPDYFAEIRYRDAFAGACVLGEMGKDQYLESDAAARGFFEGNFTPYRLKVGWKKEGQLTGYYEAPIEVSQTQDEVYRYPLYAAPGDQVTINLGAFRNSLSGTWVGRLEGSKVVPYYTRKEIDQGAFDGRGLELLWAKDLVSIYFLQVQGSGRGRFPDGSFIGIGYAGKNGHANTLAGRTLVEAGHMKREDLSMQSIRRWFEDHPDMIDEILHEDDSFVFFRINSEGGPYGSSGAELTAERSIAIDPKHIPYGLPVWISGSHPDPADLDGEAVSFDRLFITQDSGGAIKGEMRADIFFGFGEQAELIAGHMNHQGVFTLLLPNEVTP